MRKFYCLLLPVCLLLANKGLVAQTEPACSVTISTSNGAMELNCTVTTIILTATPTAADTYSYSWWLNGNLQPSTYDTIQVKEPGTYKVMVTSYTGDQQCIASAFQEITMDRNLPTVKVLSDPNPICSGKTSTLDASGAITYLWQHSSEIASEIKVTPTVTTYYTVTGTGANGCSADAGIEVHVNELPTATIQGPAMVCKNSTDELVTINGKGGQPPYTFAFHLDNDPTIQTISTPVGSSSVSIHIPTNELKSIAYVLQSVKDNNECRQVKDTSAIVTIVPVAILSSAKTKSICSGSPVGYQASSEDATTFSWTRQDVKGIREPGKSGNSGFIGETLHNDDLLPVVVTYFFTLVTGSGCTTIDSVKVTVNPTPFLTNNKDTSVCNDAPFHFEAKSSAELADFSWRRPAVAGINTPPSRGTATTIDETLHNTESDPRVVKYIFRLSSNSGCVVFDTVRVTVKPSPVMQLTGNGSICSDSEFMATATSADPTATFSWKRLAVDGITPRESSGSSVPVIETLRNAASLPRVVTYTFEMTTGSGCTAKNSKSVIVNPTPVIQGDIHDTTFCNGIYVNGLSFWSSSPDSVISWKTDDTTVIGLKGGGIGSIQPFIARNTTGKDLMVKITVSLKASANNCKGRDSSFTITVQPAPTLINKGTTTICSGEEFLYSPESLIKQTKFRWTRPGVDSITSRPRGGSSDPAAAIRDTLINSGYLPKTVTYYFDLDAGLTCNSRDSVKVIVNPTPVTRKVNDTTFCDRDSATNGFQFSSNTPGAIFHWSINPQIFIGFNFNDSNIGNIPRFKATNATDKAVTVKVTVYATVGSGNTICKGPDSTFSITVVPVPTLKNKETTTICSGEEFLYSPESLIKQTKFRWTRPGVDSITSRPRGGSSDPAAAIRDTLINIGSLPKTVTYYFDLDAGLTCNSRDSVKVIVNPTPVTRKVNDTTFGVMTFCGGDSARNGLQFSSNTPGAVFHWSINPQTFIGFNFNESNIGNIPRFKATNTTNTGVTVKVTVYATVGSGNTICRGPDSTFSITVKPSPPRPNFTSLFGNPDNSELSLCNGSQNVNFNVNAPDSNLNYNWEAIPLKISDHNINIKNFNSPNTVITFPDSKDAVSVTIKLSVKNDPIGCKDSALQTVRLNGKSSGIEIQKIFMLDSNVLIYPDVSFQGKYQWGYDTFAYTNHFIPYDTFYSRPSYIAGQVYKYFIPPSLFIKDYKLDTSRFKFWVMLRSASDTSCSTRVYYNGVYANTRVIASVPVSDTIKLQIIPNPNRGIFNVSLKGNIYGNIRARITNAMGQVVFRKDFTKMIPAVTESMNTGNLPGGVYFLQLYSSDLKTVISRFIIQR